MKLPTNIDEKVAMIRDIGIFVESVTPDGTINVQDMGCDYQIPVYVDTVGKLLVLVATIWYNSGFNKGKQTC